MENITVTLTREEFKICLQGLNEVIGGSHALPKDEFHVFFGVDRDEVELVMDKLSTLYEKRFPPMKPS